MNDGSYFYGSSFLESFMLRYVLGLSAAAMLSASVPSTACTNCAYAFATVAARHITLATTSVLMPAGEFKKPKANTKKYDGKALGALWVNPKQWVPATEKQGEHSDFELEHETGNAQVIVMSSKDFYPFDLFMKGFMDGMKEVAPDIEQVSSEDRTVNGAKLKFIRLKCTMNSMPITYFGYIYSGARGSVQVLVTLPSEIADELYPDIENALNGLTVK